MENIKKWVEEGVFGAITLDTSIFDRNNLNFESGLLKHLKQFRYGSTKLIISDIVYKEVMNHLKKKTTNSVTELENALNQIRIPWLVDEKTLNEVKLLLIGNNSADSISKIRLQAFINETNAEVIEAGKLIDVQNLIDRYFDVMPPFEETGKKKNEFPDAIALLTIDAWANNKNTKVLVITTDKGWKDYCDKSERLVALEDLNTTLSLFQLHNEYKVCFFLSEEVKKNNLCLWEAVEKALINQSWNMDFTLEAEAVYPYESEITEIVYKNFEFLVIDESEIYFRPIEVDDSYVVTEANIRVKYEVEGNFYFSVWDSIDKEDIPIGGGTKTSEVTVDIDVLITLDISDIENFEDFSIVDVEILNTSHDVDFGVVDLDWDGGVDEYD